MAHEEEGLWNFPPPSLQWIADVATVYLDERDYKTGDYKTGGGTKASPLPPSSIGC